LLRAKARVLLEHGTIVIETNGHPLNARILRFRDGTAVFEYDYESPHGSSHGKTRMDLASLETETVAHYLEMALLNARVRPLADQDV